MSRRAQVFREGDVAKAVKATAKAGLPIQRVEVDTVTGKIAIIVGDPEESSSTTEVNEWDSVR